jgi:hypothetical protein
LLAAAGMPRNKARIAAGKAMTLRLRKQSLILETFHLSSRKEMTVVRLYSDAVEHGRKGGA